MLLDEKLDRSCNGLCVGGYGATAEVGPPPISPRIPVAPARSSWRAFPDVHAAFATNQFGDQLIVSNAVLEVLETLKGAPQAR